MPGYPKTTAYSPERMILPEAEEVLCMLNIVYPMLHVAYRVLRYVTYAYPPNLLFLLSYSFTASSRSETPISGKYFGLKIHSL